MRKVSTKGILATLLVMGLAVVLCIQRARGTFSTASTGLTGRSVNVLEATTPPPLIDVTFPKAPPVKIHELRNPFHYAMSPDEVRREQDAQAAAKRLARAMEERRRLQAEEEAKAEIERARLAALNPPKPKPPPIDFRYIGKMGPAKATIAILEDAAPGGEKYTASEGEVILDKYRIIKIDFDSVTVGYTNPEWAQFSKVIKMGA